MVEVENETYLLAEEVRQRYGNANDMWILRRQREDGFPQAEIRRGRRLWAMSKLLSWERTLDPVSLAEAKSNRSRAAKAA